MSDPKDPLLLEHEIDGIRELDNKLPRWWVWLFNGSIVFAIVYFAYYHLFDAGDLMIAQYEKEMKLGETMKLAALNRFEGEMQSMKPASDELTLATGKRIFSQMCAPCHREDGGGLVGPNLTDDYWIHGPQFADNLRIIYNGVPDKGMVTWKTLLRPQDIHAVGSYIYQLRGTKPANAKPPENRQPATPAPNIYE